MATKLSPKEQAQKALDAANKLGYTIHVGLTTGNIVTITKNFTPGDMAAYVQCDQTYYDVLGHIPTTSLGSQWGTDGSGVGGHSAHQRGLFEMNKSGCSVRVLKALLALPGVLTRAR